jgi:16S rRNA (guanine527-N7)-methyltransferase
LVQSNSITLLFEGAGELEISLTEEQLSFFMKYLIELKAWNTKINLISRKNDQEIILKDFLDSLTPLKYLPPNSHVLDLGSGAGFPGIPLKIVRPELTLLLLEATLKKINFLKYLIRTLNLQDVDIYWTGESNIPCLNGRFDFIISRAFGSLTKLASMGLPFLKPGGIILAMKGSKGRKDLERDLSELKMRDLEVAFLDHFLLPILSHERFLIGLRKKIVSRETFC